LPQLTVGLPSQMENLDRISTSQVGMETISISFIESGYAISTPTQKNILKGGKYEDENSNSIFLRDLLLAVAVGSAFGAVRVVGHCLGPSPYSTITAAVGAASYFLFYNFSHYSSA